MLDAIEKALRALREALQSDHLTPYVESRLHIAVTSLEEAHKLGLARQRNEDERR